MGKIKYIYIYLYPLKYFSFSSFFFPQNQLLLSYVRSTIHFSFLYMTLTVNLLSFD